MLSQYVSKMGLGPVQAASMILFLCIYLVAMAWAFRPGSKQLHEQIARRLLEEDKK